MSILEAMWLILWAVGCLWAVPALLIWAVAKHIERSLSRRGQKTAGPGTHGKRV